MQASEEKEYLRGNQAALENERRECKGQKSEGRPKSILLMEERLEEERG
jgi:hypothetical protein